MALDTAKLKGTIIPDERVMHVQAPLSQTWDLDVFFPGGSESQQLTAFLDALEADIAAFRKQVDATGTPKSVAELAGWTGLLDTMQDLAKRVRHVGAFISCLNSQNMKDEKAKLLGGRTKQIGAAFGSATTALDAQILGLSAEVFAALIAMEQYHPLAFNLSERRRRAEAKMGAEKESLVGDLSVDGYHAWGELYNTVVGRTSVPFEGKQLSVGQAFNKMSSGDRAVRKEVFAQWEKAWGEQSELIGAALNHLAGYRINLYKHRGWDSVLSEPLDTNRMTPATLNVMWETVEKNKGHLLKYMERKAKLLGLSGLAWYDVDAPLSSATTKVTYDEAADFIIEQFHKFSPRMAEFAKKAFAGRWIEAEDRPGKRPGGFCTSFPLAQQSRVFMTFGGNMGNVSTLAHELGHAYHQSVMNDLPQMAQGYAMNVAETASTFAEMIVADAALKQAPTKEERLALLADKIERAIAFFMNIHARFIFETSFYELRKKGLVSVEKLNELMVTAQKKAFHDSLTEYHPLFWAAKLHFYSTGQPFYNFPYTFGYLFSSGIYARALAEGPAFQEKYVDLLRDTGRMQVEDLAARHLGVDLTKPDFWQSACDLVIADITEFLQLTE
jgi:pepF/M3 family oligoendopeptidase